MRPLAAAATAVLGLSACLSFGQVNPGPTMVNALQWVGTQPAVYVQLQGQKLVGGKVQEVDYEAYITRFAVKADGTLDTSQYRPQISIEAFVKNGDAYQPVSRIVGDGTYLYRYAYPNQTVFTAQRANSYLDIPYGSSSEPMMTMLSGVSTLTDPYSDFISDLFRQAFNTASIQFNPWIGGSQLNPASSLTSITYQNPNSSITYFPVYASASDVHLPSVTYSSVLDILGTRQIQSWSMTIWPITTVSGAKFTFVPPAGALPIAAPRNLGR